MNSIEVCLTPELIFQHELDGKIVVVVDIFRATSCFVAGLSNGISMIRPVASVDEAFELGHQGYVMAGERGGQKVAGFDIGNSPFEYLEDDLIGRKVVVSTTNGTQAIAKSLGCEEILIGAFFNLSATAKYLQDSGKDVIVHCAGWKGTVNIEDTLFAGALVDKIMSSHEAGCDSSTVAYQLYSSNRDNLSAVARIAGHAHRLAGFGVTKDIDFCVKVDEFDSLVRLDGDHLIKS